MGGNIAKQFFTEALVHAGFLHPGTLLNIQYEWYEYENPVTTHKYPAGNLQAGMICRAAQ